MAIWCLILNEILPASLQTSGSSPLEKSWDEVDKMDFHKDIFNSKPTGKWS
jgi:hypothetical protein